MKRENQSGNPQTHQHNRGVIQDNALKALVTSELFRSRTQKNRKGAGSYNRQKFKRFDFE